MILKLNLLPLENMFQYLGDSRIEFRSLIRKFNSLNNERIRSKHGTPSAFNN
jgi:hypothetical protein